MEDTHPAQQLLNRANRWYTRGDLWRATEIYLNLWGSAFWALDRDEEGVREIWPLRPDRVSILPDRKRHIRGFVYQGHSGPVPYTPEEVIWLRYFNPLEGKCSDLRGSEQPAAFQEGIETSSPPGAKEGCQGHLAVGALP